MSSNRRIVQTYVILAAVTVILLNLLLLINFPELFKGLF